MWSLTSLASSTNRKRLAERPLRPATTGSDGSIGRQCPPTPGPGREAHEAERLGGGGVDRLPDVDAEVVGEHRQLVDQRDVDVPEGVLEQLGQLGLLRRRHRHGRVDERVVERAATASSDAVVDAGDDLRRVREASTSGCPGRCAPGCSRGGSRRRPRRPGPCLEDRADQLLGGARVGGRLEHDAGARRAGAAPAVAAARLDVGQVGRAVAQRRRHGDHGDVEAGAGRAASVGRPVAAGGERRGELVVGDVLDVGRRRGAAA